MKRSVQTAASAGLIVRSRLCDRCGGCCPARPAHYRAVVHAYASTREIKHESQWLKRNAGGDGGIRTLDRALQPYNGLANRRLQPLGHISGRISTIRNRRHMPDGPRLCKADEAFGAGDGGWPPDKFAKNLHLQISAIFAGFQFGGM